MMLYSLILIFKKGILYGSNNKPINYRFITTVRTNHTIANLTALFVFTLMFKQSIQYGSNTKYHLIIAVE